MQQAHHPRKEDSSPPPPVVVHGDIDQSITVQSHSMERLEDGRIALHVLLVSDKRRDLPVIIQTTWFDERGAVVESSQPRTVVLPSATPVVVDDATSSSRPTAYTMSIRPSSDTRR
ncbi:MAG: hypothetical protein HC813_00255 [Planctomycetes bacterium]|nr:hypothetical protein [Planctomycetota bacterium]